MTWSALFPRLNRYEGGLYLDAQERIISIACLARISYETKGEQVQPTFAPLRYAVISRGKVLRTGRFSRRAA